MATLLNKKAVKDYVRRMQPSVRPGFPFTRVSAEFIDDLNYHVQRLIVGSMKRHPSNGKTLKHYQ